MRLLSVAIGLLLVMQAEAQVYVVPGGRGDGSSWTGAFGSVRQALETGNADVRVAIGEYDLDGELAVAGGQTLSGGWHPASGVCLGDGAERTVLRAKGTYRVATVAGKINGFTITGGLVIRGKGGGVYVKSGGSVENCIIRNNMAGSYYPRVGDVYCGGDIFLRKEEITASNVSSICGIVFWVNPDTTALSGSRGWVVALKVGVEKWAKKVDADGEETTGEVFLSVAEAMEDTAGYRHTKAIIAKGLATSDDYPAASYCVNYSRAGVQGWYLPALRQLKMLLVEVGNIEETFKYIRKYDTTLASTLLPGNSIFSSTEFKKDMGVNLFGLVWSIENTINWAGGIQTQSKMGAGYVIPVIGF